MLRDLEDAHNAQLRKKAAAEAAAAVARERMAKATEIVLARKMQCNCDLDNWVPESDTGHSWVCRIHKAIKQQLALTA